MDHVGMGVASPGCIDSLDWHVGWTAWVTVGVWFEVNWRRVWNMHLRRVVVEQEWLAAMICKVAVNELDSFARVDDAVLTTVPVDISPTVLVAPRAVGANQISGRTVDQVRGCSPSVDRGMVLRIDAGKAVVFKVNIRRGLDAVVHQEGVVEAVGGRKSWDGQMRIAKTVGVPSADMHLPHHRSSVSCRLHDLSHRSVLAVPQHRCGFAEIPSAVALSDAERKRAGQHRKAGRSAQRARTVRISEHQATRHETVEIRGGDRGGALGLESLLHPVSSHV